MRAFLFMACASLVLSSITPAHAHWADLAVAEIRVSERDVEVMLVIPTGMIAAMDRIGDGQLSPDEIAAHGAMFTRMLGDRVVVTGDGERGRLRVETVKARPLANLAITPETHTTLRLSYSWTRAIGRLTIHYGLFVPGVSTASCLATILDGNTVRSIVFTPEYREVSLTLGRISFWSQVRGFTLLGIEHILAGYDHILFLISLLMLGGSLAAVLKTVTAFTVAHSLTLSLAALHLVQVPGRLVESAIALSIVAVAAENIWRRGIRLKDRWWITFVFGLVHGLGFAAILAEMAVPRATLAVSLASFNAGVELGQVAVVAVIFGVLRLIQTWPGERTIRRLASAGAMTAGAVWFIQRAFLS